MLKGKPVGNRELQLELRGKRGVHHLLRNYKDVWRLCRVKIREVRAYLELRLATAVKDNKKIFLQIH